MMPVPAMKLTPVAAMRARDVSRPRDEHLAEAEAAETAKGAVKGAAREARPPARTAEPGADQVAKPAAGPEHRSRRRRRA